MDFSQAERNGFILAFIEFWMDRKDKRTRQELQTAAERLLKGCREHFRGNVTRISRISGVVPPDMANEFVNRAMALLDAPDSKSFIKHAERLVRDFPKTKPWMKWWMRPSVASMLFESARKMDIDIWESIPDDNNAEEAMHWRLYRACGRNHELIEGLYALYKVAIYFEKQYDNELSMSFLLSLSFSPDSLCRQKVERIHMDSMNLLRRSLRGSNIPKSHVWRKDVSRRRRMTDDHLIPSRNSFSIRN